MLPGQGSYVCLKKDRVKPAHRILTLNDHFVLRLQFEVPQIVSSCKIVKSGPAPVTFSRLKTNSF